MLEIARLHLIRNTVKKHRRPLLLYTGTSAIGPC